MKVPRVTVSKLLVVVAVVGVNLAVGRALLADEMMLYGVGPMGLVLQAAAFRLLGHRERSRAFWFGFIVSGAAIFVLCVWGFPRPIQRDDELWTIGRLSHELTWVSWLFDFWAGCGASVAESMQSPNLHGLSGVWMYDNPNHRVWAKLTACLGLFLTQLVFALFGGLITRQLAKWLSLRPVREGLMTPGDGEAAT